MRVIADVDEADIGDVKEGQRVTFTVDAFPDDTFEGQVTQVRQEATTESNVVTYEVVISAPNDDLKLKPGHLHHGGKGCAGCTQQGSPFHST